MSLSITGLKSGAVGVTLLFSKLYDQLKSQGIAAAIAQQVPAKGRQRIQRLAWGEAFPKMREWVGDRVLQEVFKEAIELEVKPYEITYPIDRIDAEIDGDNAVLSIQEVAKHFATGYETGMADLAYQPLRDDVLTYDAQNMFEKTAHVHPDGETFGNIVDLSDLSISRSAAATPTMEEADRELAYAEEKLAQNRLRTATISEIGEAPLLVVCKSVGTFRGYHSLLTRTHYSDGAVNERRGKFRLMRDWSPASGTENFVDVINVEPGGPRPTVMVELQRPGAIEIDLPKLKRMGAMGNHALYAFGAGFPQTVVRIQT